ncbi:50S ribosomal protein L3 [Candidatus Peregrinibacteria bacterium CG1_02_54_53]|nr:MAG: 50S ribosomal protein L3 [Candidatus Peregrinibacteria bacterium CG1_02_54_53]
MPSGLIARKVGMSRVFLESGEAVPVTYLRVPPNIVVRTKTKEKDGYDAVVLGIDPKNWRSRKGKEHVRYALQKEWAVESLEGLNPGAQVTVEAVPAEGQVTICGVSKGKGFQGVVKRHGFSRGPMSHGSHHHREPGSIGMREEPGRVLKGKRMPGRMGGDQLTLKHRPVLVCDAKSGVFAVKGPIPGPSGAAVYITIESAPQKK